MVWSRVEQFEEISEAHVRKDFGIRALGPRLASRPCAVTWPRPRRSALSHWSGSTFSNRILPERRPYGEFHMGLLHCAVTIRVETAGEPVNLGPRRPFKCRAPLT